MNENESYSDNDDDNISKKDVLSISLKINDDRNDSKNINNDINNLINNIESENIINKERISNISNINNDNNDENEKEIVNNLEKIKIEKIICPECEEIPKLEIDHEHYKIKSVCPNEHLIEDSITNYIKRSNEKLSKSIECSKCKTKMSELKNKENDMYKCNCKKYICINCKENHEKIKEDNMEHNLIEYNEKDFKCTCSKSLEDYTFFCNNCHKNLCPICEAEHPREHNIYDYSDEILSEEEINAKSKKLEEQEAIIKDFIIKLDDLIKRLVDKINQLKKTLKAHLAINKYIITKFDRSATNKQMIENIRKINFKISDKIIDFKNLNIKRERELINILLCIFDNQDNKVKYNINLPNYQKSRSCSITDINKYKNNDKLKDKIGSKITSLCQYKNGIVVGDVKGQVHCYSLTKNALNKIHIITEDKGKEIKYLYSLKNGNFICSVDNEFKIYNIKDKKHNVIQKVKYCGKENHVKQDDNIILKNNKKKIKNPKNNNRYYQMLELINTNLLYIDGDKIIILKNLSKDSYQEKPSKELSIGSNVIYMTELNENKFAIYCEDQNLIIFDSNNYNQKLKIPQKQILKKIEGIDGDKIALLGDKKLFLFSEAKQSIIEGQSIDDVIDVCTDFDKMLVACKDIIMQYGVKVNEKGKYLTKIGQLKNKKINFIYLLKYVENSNNNGDIICVYDEGKIKVFKKL